MGNPLLVILVFLGFIVLLTLAIRYGVMVAGKMMGRQVNASHRAMEHILNTEKIPPEWLEPAPADPAQAVQWQQRQRHNALERLRKLQSYAETTPAFEDAESRMYVLDELTRIREQWANLDFTQIADAPAAR
jgi:hypothetical protein